MIKTCNISRQVISITTSVEDDTQGLIEHSVRIDVVKLHGDRGLVQEQDPSYVPSYDGWNNVAMLLLKLETLDGVRNIHFEQQSDYGFTHTINLDGTVEAEGGDVTDTDVIQAWYRLPQIVEYLEEIEGKVTEIREETSSSV